MQLRLKQSAKVLNWAAQVIGLAFGMMTIGYFVGRLLVGERLWVIELISSLMPTILFPTFIFAIYPVITRRKRLALVHVPALALMIIQYTPQLLPHFNNLDPENDLRVLTYNLASISTDSARLANVIRSANADVVALQELLSPTAAALTEELADLYPYHALHANDAFARGVGIFSRYPIVDDLYLDHMVLGGQRVRLVFEETEITIFNVHPVSPRTLPPFDSSVRGQEIVSVLEMAAHDANPHLLVGDFNITDQTEDYAHIAAGYGDAFRASGVGFGFSFPNLTRFGRLARLVPPFIRIDYVFYDEHWGALTARVLGDHGGSDHYPVYAELTLFRSSG